MTYRYQKINEHLTDYVRTVLVFDNHPGADSSDLPLFTKGMAALLCCMNDNSHDTTIYGVSVPDEKWEAVQKGICIAFFFKPFAIGPIFKLPATALKEKPAELNLWNAQKAMAVNMQLLHSKSTEEKVGVLTHLIATQIQHNQRECEIIRYATDQLMQDSHSEALHQLLTRLNLTERTFQRIFKKYVGISPNEYRRICQFYFAFSQLKGGHFEKLTDVAYANGYFDQSHYIRSFKEFTNITL